MRLDRESRALLGSARIGMLALAAKPQPLVNPAAFSFSRDAVWMTTSRHAMKLALARRDPRASFLVDDGRHCVLLEGELDVFDALDVPSQIRALLEGPGFYLSLARYAVKNAAFVGGYLRDLARIPGDWWPQNRAVLRLRARRAWSLPTVPTPPAEPASIPLVPASVRRTLAHVAVAYLCTLSDDAPLMAPALWAADGSISVVTGSADFLGLGRRGPAGLVIESHHTYRATRMIGAYVRGQLSADGDAKRSVKERYGLDIAPPGMGLDLEPERVTWWRGFKLQTAESEELTSRRAAP
ncbi:MAG: hypothetical protein E6J02_12805 [Chloroflexi bacterium]|nr:MAG: hypothetical protein E6J02_12805 [Chloroflexota bacterium]TME15635.1 MAG: hypothetical protein E6I70_13370 [Chloroflexota bacterium]TME18637.1 MAG: hypothetical protein E6I63_01100 [Chloroflexota bacterium]